MIDLPCNLLTEKLGVAWIKPGRKGVYAFVPVTLNFYKDGHFF